MKRIILFFVCIPMYVMAQQDLSISLYYSYSQPESYGISLEEFYKSESRNSLIISAGKTQQQYYIGKDWVNGEGFCFEAGNRTYRTRNERGYFENSFLFGKINFDGTYWEDAHATAPVRKSFKGTYTYWTLINPSFGYRYKINRLFIDIFGGFTWKWELKGRGDVDNKHFDNLVFKAGIKVGCKF